MKFSELDAKKLSKEDILDLMMNGIDDFSQIDPLESEIPDYTIVLGGGPNALKTRIEKLDDLTQKHWCKNIIISGGYGWHKLLSSERSINRQRLAIKRAFKILLKHSESKKEDYPYGLSSMKRLLHRKTEPFMGKTEAELGYYMFTNQNDPSKPIGVLALDPSVTLEQESTITPENAMFSKDIIEDLRGQGKPAPNKIMLVTSAFHCRRSILTFKKHFPDSEITACPTLSNLDRNYLLNDRDFMKNITTELNKCITYIKQGDLADIDIAEVVGQTKAKDIEDKVNGNRYPGE